MSLLPGAATAEYRGATASCHFLALLAFLTILPGLIHSLLPDGGAKTIAGLDLTHSGPVIIGVFAWAGATQLVHGVAMLIVALKYRALVPLFLALVLAERLLMSLNWWVLKPAGESRPPEVYATLVLLPVIVVFLLLSLREETESP